MKTNDFSVALSALIASVETTRDNVAQNYEAAKTNGTSRDEQRAIYLNYKALETRAKYLRLLDNERIITKCAGFCKNEQMLREISEDAYALEKFAIIAAAVAEKSKARFADDYALEQALAFFALRDFAEVSHDELRRNLFKKGNTGQCHETDRQAGMICKLFERLGAGERVKVDGKKVTRFDSGAGIVKAVLALYE